MTITELGMVGGCFLFTLLALKFFLPFLIKKGVGQPIRAEGNPEHKKKEGTPTMGGVALIAVFIAVFLLFALLFPEEVNLKEFWPILALTAGFALLGFMDDYKKVVLHDSKGIRAWQKLLGQLLLATAFAVYCYFRNGSEILLPFTGGKLWDMGVFYIPFVILVVIGTNNGLNLTDGVDGLVSSVTIVVMLFLFFLTKQTGLSYFALGTVGILMGFLFYNSHPAKIFMGDTGALALGGLVAGITVYLKMDLFLLIFGFIYFFEVLSVMIQVCYFHATHGKRLFRMTPIHHHYELKGYSETQIVAGFSIVTFFLCLVAYFALVV